MTVTIAAWGCDDLSAEPAAQTGRRRPADRGVVADGAAPVASLRNGSWRGASRALPVRSAKRS
jgi:hypothetical protein